MSEQQPRSTRRPRLGQQVAIIGFVILCLVALAVFFARSGGREQLGNVNGANPNDAALVAAGTRLYATRCAGCHGAAMEGGAGVALNASGGSAQQTDEQIFAVIKNGGQGAASGMPAFRGGLSDAEIWAIVSAIKSGWPPEVQTAQPR